MRRSFPILLAAVTAAFLFGCEGKAGKDGAEGPAGSTGPTGPAGPAGDAGATGPIGPTGPAGDAGAPALTTGTINGTVWDVSDAGMPGVAVTTLPASATATTAADGTFTLSAVKIGSYSVVATRPSWGTSTVVNVGVAAGASTSVDIVLKVAANSPGTISGTVTDSKKPTPTPLSGVVVKVEGTTLTATTSATGAFSLTGVPPGPHFLFAKAPTAAFLDTDTRNAIFVTPAGIVSGVKLALSARPSDAAHYVGNAAPAGQGCQFCHAAIAGPEAASAHGRSLTRITHDGAGKATAGAFARMLNATLTTPRIVMVPLTGTISSGLVAQITGAGTLFQTGGAANALVAGDVLGYTPVGLTWQRLGTIASVDSDTQVTLTAAPTYAPGVTSLAGAKYSVVRLSRSYTKMMPEDSNDIVAPAWPGVKATNPNYDVNDCRIYDTTCAGGAKYADGQVNVYLCNLKDGVTYVNDEYVQKFGGNPYTCADATFYDGVTTPAVPMVHTEVIYGGLGDKDAAGVSHPNMGVFKQRFQGRLADIKGADAWTYTAGKNVDSLTLPIQVLESGDKVNGGFKMNGYHPTEQKFPGESWTQRTRTFSHGCAGCHNTGLTIAWDPVTVTLPFGRDGAPNNSPMTFSAIKTYQFLDENLTCEHCHGPGSEHVANPGAGSAIINPKLMTAEAERQACGKCHAYDDATNAKPLQDYGFEFPWNSDNAAKVGGGDYVPGVYDLGTYFDNWDERLVDDEAIWDPVANGGKLYGQAHRQQYVMLAQSKHTDNPYEKVTCTNCHDAHTQYLSNPVTTSSAGEAYKFSGADYRQNVLCLTCHAGVGGPDAPFDLVSKADVANLHTLAGGTVTKNGVAVAPTSEEAYSSRLLIGDVVSKHMYDKTKMIAPYDPANNNMPVGRCTSCHMPKVAKSGGYTTGLNASGDKALVEGDQASHVFAIIWPWQSNALSRGGPTFQSSYYGQQFGPTNVKYDQYGYMPNSCSKCHAAARQASILCPDTATIWPTFFPFSEHRTDPWWSGSCYTSSKAP